MPILSGWMKSIHKPIEEVYRERLFMDGKRIGQPCTIVMKDQFPDISKLLESYAEFRDRAQEWLWMGPIEHRKESGKQILMGRAESLEAACRLADEAATEFGYTLH